MKMYHPKKESSALGSLEELRRIKESVERINQSVGNLSLLEEFTKFTKLHSEKIKPATVPAAKKSKTHRVHTEPCSLEDLQTVRYFLMEKLFQDGSDIVLHNFSYKGDMMDILSVVSGRASEWQLVASYSDFLSDFKKLLFTSRPFSKHGALARGSSMSSRFYFVSPAFAVLETDCPAHAGLMWYTMDKGVPVFKVVKQPALLNRSFITPGGWQSISKRLMIRARSLTDQYVNSKFRDIKSKSIYSPLKPQTDANSNS